MAEARVFQNIMESLVAQEVSRQKSKLAPQVTKYINSTEVITFALNRLPPLYASSEEGKKRQMQKAEKKFKNDITIAVRQGFAAVERDPIRSSIPITSEEDSEYQLAVNALNDLRDFMSKFVYVKELSWQELIKINKQFLSYVAVEKFGKNIGVSTSEKNTRKKR